MGHGVSVVLLTRRFVNKISVDLLMRPIRRVPFLIFSGIQIGNIILLLPEVVFL